MPLSDLKELLCSSATPQKSACCLAVSSAQAHNEDWDFIDILMRPGCPPNICSCWHKYLDFMFVCFFPKLGGFDWSLSASAVKKQPTLKEETNLASCILPFDI